MSKIFGCVLGVALAALVGYGIFNATNSTPNGDYNQVLGPSEENGFIGDHVKGSADAPVKIIEYADFQCEACEFANGLINAALEELDGKVAIIYRNFLLSYHQNATAAASAAEAAGLQGYWKEYANLLFDNQSEWSGATPSERTALFNEYFMLATDNKGDLDKFLSDISSENISKKISHDMKMGKAADLKGTPSLYIDGALIDWSGKGSVTVNGKTITWDSGRLSEKDFTDLFRQIYEAKVGE